MKAYNKRTPKEIISLVEDKEVQEKEKEIFSGIKENVKYLIFLS